MTGSPSFTTKQIDLTFQLGTGNFGAAGQNLLKVSGLRILAQLSQILNQGGTRGATQIILRIYGLTLSVMNTLTNTGLGFGVRFNYVMVEAGDMNGTSMVFRGLIQEAFPDLSQMPDGAFIVTAVTAQDVALRPVPPNSFKGSTDVAQIMNSLASAAGLGFENNGVDVKLSNPYLHGTLMQQMELVGKAADIGWFIDGTTSNGTLAIWPKNGSRGGAIPVISPASGMIGYPSFERVFLRVRTIFNPLIKQGGQIQIPQSEPITAARGNWQVIRIEASLSSQMPDGPWEMEVLAVNAAG